MGKTIRALVTPEILQWARELDQITLEEVSATMKVPVEKIVAWEEGTLTPTVQQAKKLANKYRVPFAYFYLPDLPRNKKRIKTTDYRIFGNNGDIFYRSRELRWLERDIEDRRDTMLKIYAEEGRVPIPFSEKINFNADYDNSEVFAKSIRNLLGLTSELQAEFRDSASALKTCIANLEQKDVLIFQATKIELSEMRGLSVAYGVFPIIVLNRKDENSARLFTLCHELVHIISRTSGLCNDMTDSGSDTLELFCNKVAGMALVPAVDLKKNSKVIQIKKHGIIDDNSVRALSRDFAVSREVIIHRLWDIGFITRKQYFDKLEIYSNEYNLYKKSKSKDGFMTPALDKGTQVGKLYARTILSAYHTDLITLSEASGFLLNLKTKHFAKLEGWCY